MENCPELMDKQQTIKYIHLFIHLFIHSFSHALTTKHLSAYLLVGIQILSFKWKYLLEKLFGWCRLIGSKTGIRHWHTGSRIPWIIT